MPTDLVEQVDAWLEEQGLRFAVDDTHLVDVTAVYFATYGQVNASIFYALVELVRYLHQYDPCLRFNAEAHDGAAVLDVHPVDAAPLRWRIRTASTGKTFVDQLEENGSDGHSG